MSNSFPLHSFYEPGANQNVDTNLGIELKTPSSAFPNLSTTEREYYGTSNVGSSNIPEENQSSSGSPDGLYESLPLSTTQKSIRVLDLQASGNPHDEHLVAHLRVVHLSDKPAYTALSYVWGTYAAHHRYIKCNSLYQLKITENCWSALWHLRNSLGSITIWVDAICINQNGDQEKESQIPLMGDVYSLAHSVYIWLGPGDKQSNLALEYLREVGFQENFNSEIDTSVAQVGDLPLKHKRKLISLGYNYSCSWFWHSGKTVLFISHFCRHCRWMNSWRLLYPILQIESLADIRIY